MSDESMKRIEWCIEILIFRNLKPENFGFLGLGLGFNKNIFIKD